MKSALVGFYIPIQQILNYKIQTITKFYFRSLQPPPVLVVECIVPNSQPYSHAA